MSEITSEELIEIFESIKSLGQELGHNISWGQFEEVYEMLGKNCVHTRQAARNVIENKQVFEKLQNLHSKLGHLFNE